MTAPTALQLIEEVRRVGGYIQPNPDGKTLGVDLPKPEVPRLLPLLRERKYDLLVLLAKPDGRCPAGHEPYYWQDSAGLWHCGRCEPDPRAHGLRGVTAAVLGDRCISLTPPVGDLPAPGYWYRTAAGAVGEVVLYASDGTEVLLRELRTGRLGWYRPETLAGEMDWGWSA